MQCRFQGMNSFFNTNNLESLLGQQLRHKVPAGNVAVKVEYDEDGDVIMRDAPALEQEKNPLLDHWAPRSRW